MAYPNQIKTTGALGLGTDVFEYFKGALVDNANANPEQWPVYEEDFVGTDSLIDSFYAPLNGNGNPITVPMTRAQFYSVIDYWTVTTSSSTAFVNTVENYFRTIHGGKLYQFDEVQGNTNFPVEAVTHWGKIKTLELGMFGSVGNNGDLTATSIIGSGTLRSRVPFMSICALSYLRYGLCRFDNYGSCHPDEIIGPSLILGGQSLANRTIDFVIPSGVLLGDCERSFNYGDSWSPITEKPMIVPTGRFEISQIQLRVRKNRGAYIEAGPEIYNTIVFP